MNEGDSSGCLLNSHSDMPRLVTIVDDDKIIATTNNEPGIKHLHI